MAYERATDTTKADQNTKLLADSLDAAVAGAISTYTSQVQAEDTEAENNFQTLVAAGNMSLQDQLSYRKNQLKGTTDSATRATIRASISTLTAQINQKAFSDAYTVQLQQNAAGIESIQSVVSWLQGQLTTATDQTVIDKINSELTTQQGNLFTAQQKTLSDQTNYAKASGNMTTINNQITALSSAKSTALLAGDSDTAATIDLQIQDLQNFVTTQNITTTMQNLATSTVTGSSSATDLLNAYQSQISSADSTTPITINGTVYASAQAFWTQTRDSYVADTSGSGLFSRLTTEQTNAIQVKASNNTLSLSDIQSVNQQFATLSSNPILAPFAAQLATAKQNVLQTAADALSTKIENNFDQSLDLNTALQALQAIAAQGVNVDKTTQSILNSAAQTQSQAVQSIMTAANNLIAANPGMSITAAVTQAVSSGAGTIIPNNDLLSKTPAATATATLSTDAAGKAAAPTSTTINSATAPGATPTSASTANSGKGTAYTIKSGDTLGAIAAANGTTVAALAAANGIADPNKIQAGATINIPSAAPAAASSSQAAIDYILHPGESITQYNARVASERAAIAQVDTPTSPTPQPAAPSTAPYTAPTLPAPSAAQSNGANPPPQAAPAASSPSTPTSSPTPQPAAASSSAAATLRSSDPYNPPSGLTATKTGGGGSAYTDKAGNLYVQSSPGVYTLNNSLK